jgi:hypothetical protein
VDDEDLVSDDDGSAVRCDVDVIATMIERIRSINKVSRFN